MPAGSASESPSFGRGLKYLNVIKIPCICLADGPEATVQKSALVNLDAVCTQRRTLRIAQRRVIGLQAGHPSTQQVHRADVAIADGLEPVPQARHVR